MPRRMSKRIKVFSSGAATARARGRSARKRRVGNPLKTAASLVSIARNRRRGRKAAAKTRSVRRRRRAANPLRSIKTRQLRVLNQR